MYSKYRFASFPGDYLKNKELAIMTTRHDDASTRRQVLRAGLAAVGGVVAVSATARAQEKISQAQVQYQQSPNNGQHCSICVNFQAPASCAIVAGKINPDGWCIAFAPKA
nr:high-potential iron-sulfur protein [uncultured Rhodopila sp.]